VINGREPGGKVRAFVADVGGGTARPVTPEGIEGEAVSPDGRYVFGIAQDRTAVLYPVGGGEAKRLPWRFEQGDAVSRWSSDGKSIYTTRQGLPGRFVKVDLATGTRIPWKELQPSDMTGVWAVTPLLMTPDGKSYAYTFVRVLSDLYVVEGLR
jgi:hypothetical protein